MKAFLHYGLLILSLILINYNLPGQNPNWSMPPFVFNGFDIYHLPSSGYEYYDSLPATNLSASYSDDNGNLILFTVDEKVYDKNGTLVDLMNIEESYNYKKGHSQRLILPMGNDCKRYAIIYQASPDNQERYSSKVFGRRIYMAIYDVEGEADENNTNANPDAIGALEYYDYENVGLSGNLIDISLRDAGLYGELANPNNPPIYDILPGPKFSYIPGVKYYQERASNYQIAATELIDNCFFFIYIFDGKHIIRYKLTNNDLEYDNFIYPVSNTSTDWSALLRSEMELIKLNNGNYRIAIPIENVYIPGKIVVFDIDGITGDVIPSSQISVNHPDLHEVYGLEFNETGQYLYFTHRKSGVQNSLPYALGVFNIQNQSFATIPNLNPLGIENFRKSFIERVGNVMYLTSENYIGKLSNINSPSALTFDPSFIAIPSGNYGNSLTGGSNSPDFRYMLPSQIDMPYPSLSEMSCDCCAKFATAHDVIEVDVNSTWSPLYNPFGIGISDVYIDEELRIRAGTSLQIENMNFHFGPNARVVVERGNGTIAGAHLTLTNNTVFTGDFRCHNSGSNPCGDFEGCEKQLWQGIRVEGHKSDLSQSTAYQAKLTMSNGAKIEYAHTGVRVGHETESNYGGGIVQILNSTFKDNITGIEFDDYLRKDGSGTELFNLSRIEKNDFITTNDWLSGYLPFAFVNVKSSSGISLRGNNFENDNNLSGFALNERGMGVRTSDSRVKIDWACTIGTSCFIENAIQSQFLNLHYGIYGLNSSGNKRTVQSNYNLFENNTYGIFLSNFLNPIILDNEFKIPNNGTGLYLIATTGYMVQNNDFLSLRTGSYGHTGIYIRDSGPYYNEIYKNNFKWVTRGGYVDGLNVDLANCDKKGLKWFCNDFERILNINIGLGYQATMSNEQGNCVDKAAGNMFSTGGHNLFSANDNFPINYVMYGNVNMYPRLEPQFYSGKPTAQFFALSYCGNVDYNPTKSCPIIRSGRPPSGPIVNPELEGKTFNDYQNLAAIYQSQWDNKNNLASDDVNELFYTMQSFWHDLVIEYQWDTTGVITPAEMNTLLTTYQPQVIDRFAAAQLNSSSLNWFSSYIQSNANYENLPAVINNHLPHDIPIYFENDFFSNLENVHALNNLYIEHNSFYNPYEWEVVDNSLGKNIGGAKSLNPDDENAEQQSQINAVPNPFKESVSFDFSEYSFTGDNNILEFYDVVGKKIYSLQISKNEQDVTISADKLPEGVILFRFYTDGKLVETRKLIKVK